MINPVRPDEYEYYPPLEWITSMFECGGKVNQGVTYKSWFEAMGIRHVSVDFDPRWADFTDDLRHPLWDKHGTFDCVADIGTAEHVDGQAGFWENIHNLTKVGGYYVGQHPAPNSDSWWWHGNHYPTEEFYKSFCDLNGWQIEKMGRGLAPPNENLYVLMRRVKDKPFTMPDESLIYFNRMRRR